MPRATRRLAAAALPALLLATTACVSVRPWRDCERPCADGEVAKAQQVRIVGYDDRVLLVDDPRPGMDDRGRFVEGEGHTPDGARLGPVRVHADEICLIETRRVEGKRVAANAVLVPLAVTAAVAVAWVGGDPDVLVDDWRIDPQPDAGHCRERQADDAPPPLR